MVSMNIREKKMRERINNFLKNKLTKYLSKVLSIINPLNKKSIN